MTAGNEIVLPLRRPATSTMTSHLGPTPAAASRACAALRNLARRFARRCRYSHRRTLSLNTSAPPRPRHHRHRHPPGSPAQGAKVPPGQTIAPGVRRGAKRRLAGAWRRSEYAQRPVAVDELNSAEFTGHVAALGDGLGDEPGANHP